MIHPSIQKAYKVLEGEVLDKELALELSRLEGEDIVDLVSLANKVRNKYASQSHKCTIMNARSGACSENCNYCAQSSHHEAEAEVYDLREKQAIIAAAQKVYDQGVHSFGIVTSGYGFDKIDTDFQNILDAMAAIKEQMPGMNICASLGMLSEETASALARAGIQHYNHNLQVDPSQYSTLIAQTHSIEDRLDTIKLLKKYGIGCCVGGILGLGETMADRVSLAFTLKELDVDVIPLNVLIPIKGTPMQDRPLLAASEAAKVFALFRLIHPTKTIKFAAGRETRMNDWQGLLMLAGANGMLTGGYLTTRGRDTAMDEQLERDVALFGLGSGIASPQVV